MEQLDRLAEQIIRDITENFEYALYQSTEYFREYSRDIIKQRIEAMGPLHVYWNFTDLNAQLFNNEFFQVIIRDLAKDLRDFGVNTRGEQILRDIAELACDGFALNRIYEFVNISSEIFAF